MSIETRGETERRLMVDCQSDEVIADLMAAN